MIDIMPSTHMWASISGVEEVSTIRVRSLASCKPLVQSPRSPVTTSQPPIRITLETLLKHGYEPSRGIFLASGFDEEVSGTRVRFN